MEILTSYRSYEKLRKYDDLREKEQLGLVGK